MRKIVKAAAAASAVAMFAAVIVPLTSYADSSSTTTVNVTVNTECILGDDNNGSTSNSGAAALTVGPLTATTLSGTASSDGTDNDLGVTCNNATWALDQEINTAYTVNLMNGATVGFTPYASGTATDASDFAANTWAMKYAASTNPANAATTGSVDSAASVWHAVPANGSPMEIATGTATSGYFITQTLGAKTDGSLAAGTYTSQILYTLTGV